MDAEEAAGQSAEDEGLHDAGASVSTSDADADLGPRDPPAFALFVLRLPVALAVLALVAQLRPSIPEMIGLYAGTAVSYTAAWSRTVVAAAAFMLIVAVGRQRRAPVPLLLVEVTIAAGLAFTPPYLWGPWLNYHPFSFAIGFEFVAPLAIAWFAVCIVALVRRLFQRGPRRAAYAGTDLTAARLSSGGLPARVGAWLPWLRVPALAGTLLLVASHRDELTLAWSAATFTAAWVPLTITALAFMVIALVGRHRVPWPLLALEIVLAGMLAFTPRFQWLAWLGTSELPSALASEFTAPLAIAWFAVALIAGFEGWPRNRRVPSG